MNEEQKLQRKRETSHNYYLRNLEYVRELSRERHRNAKPMTEEQRKKKNESKRLSRMRNREKHLANCKVQRRVHAGHWPRAAFFICTDCDERAQHYHHENYEFWWSVEPLCTSCHGIRHRRIH